MVLAENGSAERLKDALLVKRFNHFVWVISIRFSHTQNKKQGRTVNQKRTYTVYPTMLECWHQHQPQSTAWPSSFYTQLDSSGIGGIWLLIMAARLLERILMDLRCCDFMNVGVSVHITWVKWLSMSMIILHNVLTHFVVERNALFQHTKPHQDTSPISSRKMSATNH